MSECPVSTSRAPAHVRTVLDAIGRVERVAGPFFDLFLRFWLSQIFWLSGLVKVHDWDQALWLAANEYPVSWMGPVAAAWLGAAVEVIAPVLLSLGLATRGAAAALLALSLVMQFAYQENAQHLAWAVLFGWYMLRGAGPISLDRWLSRGFADSAIPFAAAVTRGSALLSRWGVPAFQLFLRVWIASMFAWSGLGTAVELICPTFLLLGLGTRLFTLPLIAQSLVLDMAFQHNVEHVYWLFDLTLILLFGPGALSLDHLALAALRRRFPLPAAHAVPEGPRVVVVGAGFGGLAVAAGLRGAACRVTLVDRHNYHLFQPLLYQVATAGLSPADIATPVREIVRDDPNVQVVMGEVTGVDAAAREVLIGERRIGYDMLVLAAGAQHGYFGHDEWSAFAPGLKKIEDATSVRRRLLLAFERAETSTDPEERSALLTFVIVGGGPTGVEWAGAIAELARFGMTGEFRAIDPSAARVILVQADNRLLPTFPPALSDEAALALGRLGVELRLGAAVQDVDADGVVVAGTRVPARTVFWAAGVVASPAARWLGLPSDRAGRLLVGPDLSVPGLPEIFAIGDTAASNGWDGKPVPGLAPAAKQGGRYVAAVIRARIEGRPPPPPFRYRHAGSLATIGRKAAVADFGRIKLTGALAWWLWGAVHVIFLAGMRNRVAVALEWFWAYLTFRRGTRLITGVESGSPADRE